MSTRNSHSTQIRTRENGFALFAALLFLIVLTVLAVTVLRSSTLGERIAGNDLDRMRAYQVAEATIRDAQQDIMFVNAQGNDSAPPQSRNPALVYNRDGGVTDVPAGCNAGYCKFSFDEYNSPTPPRPWTTNANFATYGQFTGATFAQLNEQFAAAPGGAPAQQLSLQPRYWIEFHLPEPGRPARYRITAQAWGVNPNTSVVLQEIFEPGI